MFLPRTVALIKRPAIGANCQRLRSAVCTLITKHWREVKETVFIVPLGLGFIASVAAIQRIKRKHPTSALPLCVCPPEWEGLKEKKCNRTTETGAEMNG